jgi:AAHS family benzoate transporter-like MFS transporter
MLKPKRVNWIVVLFCSLVMACEGFDLVVYGNTIPLLINDAEIGMSIGSAGSIGSLAFLGMLVGGLAAGKINQYFTPKAIILVGTAAFSVAVFATGLATEMLLIALLRFVLGVGLGVVLPTSLSLARSTSGQRFAPLVVSVTMAGIPAGGTLASVTVALMGSDANWRVAFVIAGIIGLVVMLAALKGLHCDDARPCEDSHHFRHDEEPEGKGVGQSRIDCRGSRHQVDAKAVLTQSDASIAMGSGDSKPWIEAFKGSGKWLLAFFALATFADLFSYYGVSTWLTQLMREFNLPMSSSLHLTTALNLGAIGGSLASSLVAVKLKPRTVALSCGILAACCLIGISSHPKSPLVLGFLVVMTGATSISAQNLLNTLVSNAFPAQMRSGALGFTLGLGRLGAVFAPAVGGYVLEFGLGAEAVLWCFAGASILGCAALLTALARRKR